MADTEIVIFL